MFFSAKYIFFSSLERRLDVLLSNKQSKRRSVYEFDDSPRSLKQGSLNGVAPEIGQEGTQFDREARKNSGVLKRFSCVSVSAL